MNIFWKRNRKKLEDEPSESETSPNQEYSVSLQGNEVDEVQESIASPQNREEGGKDKMNQFILAGIVSPGLAQQEKFAVDTTQSKSTDPQETEQDTQVPFHHTGEDATQDDDINESMFDEFDFQEHTFPDLNDPGTPRMRPEMADELRASAHDRQARYTPNSRNAMFTRQQNEIMNPAMVDELRMSVHSRQNRPSARRQEIKRRSQERRDSKRLIKSSSASSQVFSDQSSRSELENKMANAAIPIERPKIDPELANELRQSIHGRNTRSSDKRQEIRERIMQRRQSSRKFSNVVSMDMEASFAEDSILPTRSPSESRTLTAKRRGKKKARTVNTSQRSVGTFNDEPLDNDDKHNFNLEYGQNRNTTVSYTPDRIHDGDFEAYRRDWARLTREKKILKTDAATYKKKIKMLQLQVDDLKFESRDLRKQLVTWQQKTAKINKLQTQSKIKEETTTETITKTRSELTQALNENATLKSRIHELEMAHNEREIRVQSLDETVEAQARKVDELQAKLMDAETEARFNLDEKLRIEEELAVITASQNGEDISEAIHQLEQDKAKWLEEKDRALNAKRLALEEESKRLIERENRIYNENAEQLVEATERTLLRDEEDQRIHRQIHDQLQDLSDANYDLQEQLKFDHIDHRLEVENKDKEIETLQHEISKLQRKFAASLLREQDLLIRRSEVQNMKDAVKDSKRHHRLLGKQIKKLQHENQKQSDSWKEIILPGYRNMRGVTFGAPSDELAGFLTILIEDQKAKQEDAISNLQKEIRKYIKKPKKKKKKKKKTKALKKTKAKKLKAKTKKKVKKKSRNAKKRSKDPSKSKSRKKRDQEAESSSSSTVDTRKMKAKKSSLNNKKKMKRTRASRKLEKDSSSASTDRGRGTKKKPKAAKPKKAEKHTSRKETVEDNLKFAKVEDVSLFVMKRDHEREKKPSASEPNRLSPVVPPDTIVLQ